MTPTPSIKHEESTKGRIHDTSHKELVIPEVMWDYWMSNRASPSFWKGTNQLSGKQYKCSRSEWNGEAEKTRER